MELHNAAGAAGTGAVGGKGKVAVPTLTTGSTAARLKVKSARRSHGGRGHLTFMGKKSTFSGKNADELQSATSYYK